MKKETFITGTTVSITLTAKKSAFSACVSTSYSEHSGWRKPTVNWLSIGAVIPEEAKEAAEVLMAAWRLTITEIGFQQHQADILRAEDLRRRAEVNRLPGDVC